MGFSIINDNKIIKKALNPKLIEPGTYYFFKETLKNCKKTKYNVYNNLFNIIITIIFVLGISLFLYIQYKNRNDEKLREKKEFEKQNQYSKIVKIIQEHNYEKAKEKQQIITNLPTNTSDEYLGPQHLLDENIKYFI